VGRHDRRLRLVFDAMIRALVIFMAYAHDLAETIREALGIVPRRRR
jgi:hypothetical protein